MKWLFRILAFLIGFAALWGVVFLILTTYGWEKVWEHQFGPADQGAVIFEDFAKGPKPNQALMCPFGICKESDVDKTSPIYNVSADKLKAGLIKALASEKSLKRVDDQSDPMRLRYVQRTRLMRFPDTINIQIFALGDDSSTLALYSTSLVGESDFGVNLQRANRWLSKIKQLQK